MLRIATCSIVSSSPYSQSHYFKTNKPTKMSHHEFEEKYWRERMHVNSDGYVYCPPMAFKRATDEAAARLGLKVPGRGQTQYTKFFVAGALVLEPVVLHDADGKPIDHKTVHGDWVMCDAQGKKGSKSETKVKRCFPIIPTWQATVEYHLFDDVIPNEIFEHCFRSAGTFVGVGRFRPEKGGFYGRFRLESVDWNEIDV